MAGRGLQVEAPGPVNRDADQGRVPPDKKQASAPHRHHHLDNCSSCLARMSHICGPVRAHTMCLDICRLPGPPTSHLSRYDMGAPCGLPSRRRPPFSSALPCLSTAIYETYVHHQHASEPCPHTTSEHKLSSSVSFLLVIFGALLPSSTKTC